MPSELQQRQDVVDALLDHLCVDFFEVCSEEVQIRLVFLLDVLIAIGLRVSCTLYLPLFSATPQASLGYPLMMHNLNVFFYYIVDIIMF